jgi:hypothetical protein
MQSHASYLTCTHCKTSFCYKIKHVTWQPIVHFLSAFNAFMKVIIGLLCIMFEISNFRD